MMFTLVNKNMQAVITRVLGRHWQTLRAGNEDADRKPTSAISGPASSIVTSRHSGSSLSPHYDFPLDMPGTVTVYVDVENGCHKLLKALAKCRMNPKLLYQVRAYTGNSLVSVPKGIFPNVSFVVIRNDLPLKEYTDVSIILDLHEALRCAPAGTHVLVAGNDKRYAALSHILRKKRAHDDFHFMVNYNTTDTVAALTSM